MKTQLTRKLARKSCIRTAASLAAFALGGAVASAMLLASAGTAVSAEPEILSGYGLTSWQQNGQGGRYFLEVADGELPVKGGPFVGMVLSDANCMPDQEGLSHCLNDIRFADGNTVTVIDNHNMAVNRCLRPGEMIAISSLDESWVIGLTNGASVTGQP